MFTERKRDLRNGTNAVGRKRFRNLDHELKNLVFYEKICLQNINVSRPTVIVITGYRNVLLFITRSSLSTSKIGTRYENKRLSIKNARMT
jgi:hypothetical protein